MLSNLKPARGSVRRRKRVGRGPGSTHGKTSGRGTKGQLARSGGKVKAGFEGGQMPLQRRLPKRGFTNVFRKEFTVVNVRDLARVQDVDVIDPDLMVKLRLARKGMPVKVLAEGDIQRPVTVRAHKVSAAAAAKIEKAGGKVELV
ncbi:MAG: 50S ribosomal protein L15 [bacterium]|nr:MAG: 50S ribosomal protein L15 [bacterium]